VTPDSLVQAIEAAPRAGRTELVLSPDALDFAASLQDLERMRLKQRLKAAGVTVSDWWRAVEAIVRARRAKGGDDQPDWQRELVRGEDGRPVATARNVGLILRNWQALESLRLNGLTLEAELNGKPLSDGGYFRLREAIEENFRVVISSELIQDGIAAVAEDRTYHPVRDYLEGLPPWDKKPRLSKIHEHVLLAPPDPLYGRMVEAWFVSAVARIYDPGCQVDTCLCLFSEAGGKKKTTFFRVASKGFWNGGHVDPSDKDTVLVAHQSWIKLLDEVDDLTKRSEWSALKRWMTDPTDTFRPPYGRRPARFPRAFVFGATTNKQEFLPADSAAARRFWTIPVGDTQDAQIELLESRLNQLWAEARHIYMGATDNGKRRAAPSSYLYWLKPDEETTALGLAGHHQTDPVWLNEIEAWLASPMRGSITVWRTEQILEGAIKVSADGHTKTARDNVGDAMRRLGYVLKNHTYDDGKQKKAWVKT
jgi:predicted P-loop ATPase